MVLLDENFNASAIYEASRVDVLAALALPGSRSRNERGALGLSKVQIHFAAAVAAAHQVIAAKIH
jgi:hypothetical protein